MELELTLAESRRIFGAATAAWRVENMALDEDGRLSTAGYVTKYEPFQGSLSGNMHGCGYTSSGNCASELVLARIGPYLYSYRGWDRAATAIVSGLIDDPAQRFPDSFIPLPNGDMIWCNGRDFPLVVNRNGRNTLPLGFQSAPSSPKIIGPAFANVRDSDGHQQPPNHYGYSVPGSIGTIAASSNTGDDGLTAGSWVYYTQLEDIFGNLSTASAGVVQELQVRAVGFFGKENATDYERLSTPDELRRSFAISQGKQAGNAKYVSIYRTPDTRNTASGDLTPRLLSRCALTRGFYFDDVPDSDLLFRPALQRIAPVQSFAVGALCNGRLVAGNFSGAQSTIRWSKQSFYGTWSETAVLTLDSDVTAIVEHFGDVMVFTETMLYVLELDDEGGKVVSRMNAGCAGPRCVVSTSNDGAIVWLQQAGKAWRRGSDGQVAEIGSPIRDQLRLASRSDLARCTSFFDPNRCQAVFPISSGYMAAWNSLVSQNVLTGWSRFNLGLIVRGSSPGPRGTVLVLADRSASQHLWVWDRQTPLSPGGVPGTIGTPTSTWESRPIRVDPIASDGLVIKAVNVHVIESSGDGSALAGASVTIEKTGRRGAFQKQNEFKNATGLLPMRGSDFPTLSNKNPASIQYATLGASSDLDKANWHLPDVVIQRVPFNMAGTSGFCVKVTSGLPMRLVGISFEIERAQGKNTGYTGTRS